MPNDTTEHDDQTNDEPKGGDEEVAGDDKDQSDLFADDWEAYRA